ncbi:hypothetical protein [Sandaracinus amylolyticus]|uniref:Uncharacterized protein n=1 Tax=Sandaracinus amylolyticus TaxID=927083 RepID=A0A0F6YIK3_9BACT|nr:hypothetical protein [Sandaracinus amylolyticus]AKF05222.1 hypothetical protein DB32_002371 [Sandaracinus amylolyticus]
MARSIRHDERGAMIVIGLFFAVMLSGFLYYLIGIGETIVYRETMQDAADAGAFSAAVVHARGMNVLVLINLIMAALLAVLIALKLIETLIIGAIAVCAALAFVTFGATLAAIPPLNVARTAVSNVHRATQRVVFPLLRIGNRTARIVRVAIPPAATVRAYDVAMDDVYAPSPTFAFTWPIGIGRSLPTEDGDFRVLCRKGGEAVGEVVALPFRRIHSRIASWVSRATGGLAATFSEWFCSGSGGPPNYSYPIEFAIPEVDTPAARECRECQGDGCDAICQRSEQEQQSSQPAEDANPYDCPTRGDGTEEPMCTQRAEQARLQCRPGSGARKFNYVYQDAQMTRWYWREQIPGSDPPQYRDRHTGDSLADAEDERMQDRLDGATRRMTEGNPCFGAVGFPGADGWSWTWSTEDHTDLCGRNPPTMHPDYMLPGAVLPIGRDRAVSYRYRIIRRLFACHEQRDQTLQVEGGSGVPSNTSDMRPQRMRARERDGTPIELGEDSFQVRMIVTGREPGAHMERGVELANWGRDVASQGGTLALLRNFGEYSVAQAEFFYPSTDLRDREEWMWNMRWRARMRRFVPPFGDDGGSSCREMGGSGSGGSCAQTSGFVGMMQDAIVH